MMTQNELKEKVQTIHSNEGVSYTHIAQNIGIGLSMLSLWLHGKRNLSDETMIKANQYISGRM